MMHIVRSDTLHSLGTSGAHLRGEPVILGVAYIAYDKLPVADDVVFKKNKRLPFLPFYLPVVHLILVGMMTQRDLI